MFICSMVTFLSMLLCWNVLCVRMCGIFFYLKVISRCVVIISARVSCMRCCVFICSMVTFASVLLCWSVLCVCSVGFVVL